MKRIIALACALGLITAGQASAATVNSVQLQNNHVNVGAPISGNTVLDAMAPLSWLRVDSRSGRLSLNTTGLQGPAGPQGPPGPAGTGGGPDLSRQVYVGDSGSDSSDCLSWQTACRTVQRALDARHDLGGTTTINVGKGSFAGGFEIGGSDVLRGSGRENTWIRGSATFNGNVIDTENGSKTLTEGVRVLSDNPQFTGTLYRGRGTHAAFRDSEAANEDGRQNVAGGTYGGTGLWLNQGEGTLVQNVGVSRVHLAERLGSTGHILQRVDGGQVYKLIEQEPDAGHNTIQGQKVIEVYGPNIGEFNDLGGTRLVGFDCCESSEGTLTFRDGNGTNDANDAVNVQDSVFWSSGGTGTHVVVESRFGIWDNPNYGPLTVTGEGNQFQSPSSTQTPTVSGDAVGTTTVNQAKGPWPQADVVHDVKASGSS